MKKLMISVAAVVAVCGLVRAGDLEHNVGIGVGSMIFAGQDGLIQQVLAATTNGIFGNQTFAISSGTLGARRPDSIVQNEQLRKFVAENMDNLAKDIATGRGETLDTFSEMMSVPQTERVQFHQSLQQNFRKIYPSATVTHLDVLANIAEITG